MECDSGNCSRENTKLGAMLTSEKANISCGNFNCENVGLFTPKSLQNKHFDKKGSDKEEELVRYMSSLPTYLQGGKPQQEKAFNVGVLDWKHLERWQSKAKQMPSRFNVVSPPSTSSNASSFSSTEESSSNSSREYLAPYLMKVKLDFKICKTVRIGRQGTATKRAQLQAAITNGVPQFRFSGEKEDECVTATVERLSSSTKNNNWIYTFSTMHDMKKKKKKKDRNKVTGNISSAVIAQMKVSDVQLSDVISREFVLFNTGNINQQTSELAAIVVKFSGCEEISMNVILPGGDHGLPRKGEPSSLIERWKSGGSCDCGGWDLGCKLRILSNDSAIGRKYKFPLSDGQFELFSQVDFTMSIL
ncbi:unnamed protein product [Cuscuta campestris]|uniref:Uncharacterized protein n=1 Tax=Cuscuta campestris TaxID=132261 RepID=A0A484NQ62_9ASTE|nr:unnamed protein product [Cuscuta campestris]